MIQKADKNNPAFIIDKDVYKKKMNAMISGCSKFQKIHIQKEKHLNFILNTEKGLKKIANKPLYEKGWFTQSQYLMETQNCLSAIIHKPVNDNCLSSHPILLAVTTPTSVLVKFLAYVLKSFCK